VQCELDAGFSRSATRKSRQGLSARRRLRSVAHVASEARHVDEVRRLFALRECAQALVGGGRIVCACHGRARLLAQDPHGVLGAEFEQALRGRETRAGVQLVLG